MRFGGRRRIAAVALLALAVGVGGCGGGGGGGQLSKSDYQKKLRSVGQDLNSLRSIGSTSGSASSRYDKLRQGLRKAADSLSKITPPSDAKADNDKLAQGLRDLANDLAPIEKATKDKNAQELQTALTGFQNSQGAKKIQAAISDLRSKGYNGT